MNIYDIDKLFRELFFGDFNLNTDGGSKPPIDHFPIYQGDTIVEWCVQLALAGFTEDEISVHTDGNYLIVEGDNRFLDDSVCPRKDLSPKFTCSFKRKIQVSDRLNLSKTRVNFFNGLLNIQIPLKEAKGPEKKLLFGKDTL